jgi:hypothetical protein
MIKREDIQVGAEFNWKDGPELFKVAPELFDFTTYRFMCADGDCADTYVAGYLVGFQVGGRPPRGTTKVVVDSLPEGFQRQPTTKAGKALHRHTIDEAVRKSVYFFREYLNGLLSAPTHPNLAPLGEDGLRTVLAVELGVLLNDAYKMGYEDASLITKEEPTHERTYNHQAC